MFWILALISIFIGLAIAVLDGKFLFDSLTWFVLAIAFAVMGDPVWPPSFRRRTE